MHDFIAYIDACTEVTNLLIYYRHSKILILKHEVDGTVAVFRLNKIWRDHVELSYTLKDTVLGSHSKI